MKAIAIGNLMRVCCAALACSASFAVRADPPADVMNIVREPEIKWVQSLVAPGVATAVISGNPAIPGQPYVVRAHPNKIHYDGAKNEEVIVQITGVSPGTTTPVDESGQPKK